MKKLQSTNPLGQLLISLFESSGLKLPQFVQAMGYRNVNKGIRNFQRLLAVGTCDSLFIDRLLASPYAPKREAFHVLLQQHVEQLFHDESRKGEEADAEGRRAFQPFVHAVPALDGSASVTKFALIGGFSRYTVQLPRHFVRSPQAEQFEAVGKIVRRSFAECGGEISFLGPIRYYLFFHSWDEPAVAFSVQGEMLGIADGAEVPSVSVVVGSKRVEPEVLHRMFFSSYGAVVH
jgi:hypothetical protein